MAFKSPILVTTTSHFGFLNTKIVLWNVLKVKCHFWHLKTIFLRLKCWRLVFMKWTPGWATFFYAMFVLLLGMGIIIWKPEHTKTGNTRKPETFKNQTFSCTVGIWNPFEIHLDILTVSDAILAGFTTYSTFKVSRFSSLNRF